MSPNYLRNTLLTATLFTSALVFSVPASGAAITPQVFTFVGTCKDCADVGTATLTLASDYTLGSEVTAQNFISFTYDGTNLQGPFTIFSSDSGFNVSGNMPNGLPGFANLSIATDSWYFFSDASEQPGYWELGSNEPVPQDYGPTHVWSSADASATPEPATMSLLALGLGAVTFFGRRRAMK